MNSNKSLTHNLSIRGTDQTFIWSAKKAYKNYDNLSITYLFFPLTTSLMKQNGFNPIELLYI